ncbi:MAG: hypothetical protein ABEJ36_00510 [Candidatus Nanosalina sp.]
MVDRERRRFLKVAGTAFAAGALSDRFSRENRRESFLDDLDEVIWENVRMPSKTWDIVEGFSRRDLNYWSDNFQRLRHQLVDGGDIDGFQSYSPDVVGLSNPGENTVMRMDGLGRVSGFMKNGKEQIPFEPTRKVNQEEGIFAGIKTGGNTEWLPFDGEIERERTGAGQATYRFELENTEVLEEAQVIPEENSGELSFTVRNTSEIPVEGEFVTYGRASSNNNHQNPIFFKSEPNSVKSEEKLRWESLESEADFEIEMDTEVEDSGTFRAEINDWFSEYRQSSEAIDNLFETLLMGLMDDSGFRPKGIETSFEKMFQEAVNEIEARYGSAYLMTPINLEPGESEEITVWINGEPDESRVWDRDTYDFEEELHSNLLMHTQEEGLHAAHNIQPMYYPTWIRDSVFTLEVLRKEGDSKYMRQFYTDFLPKVQRDNGSFNQCFYPDRSEAGTWYSEMDQPAIAATKFPQINEEYNGDIYQDMEARASYAASLMRILENVEEGQVNASPDFAEQPTDFFRQSLWTQSFAYESLKRAAENYSLEVDLSELEDPPRILTENSENGVFRIESDRLMREAEKIRNSVEEIYFEGEKITNEGLLMNERNQSTIYSKVLEETTLLHDLERDRELFESLEPDMEEFWSPGFASYGKAMDMYGMENQKIKDRLRNSRTDLGKLPERVRTSAWRDAMELAWGSAETLDLLRNH